MITAATMFSGIGAPECSMPHWDWRWCAEIEKFPSAVLAARHPITINLGDINAEDFIERAEKAGRPDVIVFGSPCQDFSIAGRRVGLDGDRGNLALVALGIVNRLRPRWVVFENVPGLLSSYSGMPDEACPPVTGESIEGDEDSDFAAFLALVQQCGYFGCYRITDAQYAGVPQRRRRIFAVFHLGDWRPAAAVLFEPEGLRGDHPPSREAGKGVAPTISARPTGGGDLAKSLKTNSGGIDREDGHTLITGAVSSKWSKGSGGPAGDECYNLVALNGRQDPDVYGDRTCGGQVAVAFQTRIGRNGRGAESEVVPALNGADAGATSDMRPCVAVSDTLTVGANQTTGFQTEVVAQNWAVRRLTPTECERLQAFPDDYTLIQYRGNPAADGPRYKALGNAMNVNEVRWVLRRIEQFETTVV